MSKQWIEYLIENDNMRLAIMVIIPTAIIAAVAVMLRPSEDKKNKRLLKRIDAFVPILCEDFERGWIAGGNGNGASAGFKYIDAPGCYVITVYDRMITTPESYFDYTDIYIGQSVNMCMRVHSHFTGKGQGNIYADVRAGMYVYVKFIPCRKERMNALERDLISIYNATESYNNTSGGGKRRE